MKSWFITTAKGNNMNHKQLITEIKKHKIVWVGITSANDVYYTRANKKDLIAMLKHEISEGHDDDWPLAMIHNDGEFYIN